MGVEYKNEPSIKEAGFVHKKLANCMEANPKRECIKAGDMFYNPVMKHLFVVVSRNTVNIEIGETVFYKLVMITSKNYNNFPADSRFIEGYFARTIMVLSQSDIMKTCTYIGAYDNNQHLVKVRKWLRKFKL